MREKDKDLMERYIYEVVRRLPKQQRDEIAMELQALISDMAEDSSINEVLKKLGDPSEFAKQYHSPNSYLISPDYYDNYEWVLKIVLGAILVSSLVLGSIQVIISGSLDGSFIDGVFRGVVSVLTSIIASGIGGFGVVTLMFAILERQNIRIDIKKKQIWSVDELDKDNSSGKIGWIPEYLAPVPDKRGLISRAETTVAIIFVVIVSGLLIFTPFLFGAFVFEGGEIDRIIPIFNLDKWNIILPFLILSLMAGFVDEIVRLVKGCYCKTVLISTIVTGVLQMIFAYLALKVMPFWNTTFLNEIEIEIEYNFNDIVNRVLQVDYLTNIILCIMFIIIFIEVGSTAYKTSRYGTDR